MRVSIADPVAPASNLRGRCWMPLLVAVLALAPVAAIAQNYAERQVLHASAQGEGFAGMHFGGAVAIDGDLRPHAAARAIASQSVRVSALTMPPGIVSEREHTHMDVQVGAVFKGWLLAAQSNFSRADFDRAPIPNSAWSPQ